MTIVFVIDSYSDFGGAGIATKRLVNELRKRHHTVRIVAAIHEDPNDPDFFQVPRLVMPTGGKIQNSMQFYFGRNTKKVLRKAMIGGDIVQIQLPFLMARDAVKIAKELKIPCLGAFHIQPQNITLAMGLKSKIFEDIIWSLFRYFLFNRVNKIIAPSIFAKNLLIANKVKASIIPISNGIPAEYINKRFERPEWMKDHFVIISIGRHANEKRYPLIIDGIKKSKYADNIQLILAGKGELSNKLIDLGKSLPIPPLIEYVSTEDKLRFLTNSDLYVHASIIELESLATLEAIGCGLPCLISNSVNSAAPQFSLDNRFLFKADDVDDLAAKINYWYENKSELRSVEIKEKLRRLANNYVLEESVTQYENLYKEILLGK